MSNEISEAEAAEIMREYNSGKQNFHSFLTRVIQEKDTTKTGNLTADELGLPKLPLRSYKELALFSEDIAGAQEWADYFNKIAEIQTSTSLSKDGFLMKLGVTIKKELADTSPAKKANKGWFKKKGESNESQS